MSARRSAQQRVQLVFAVTAAIAAVAGVAAGSAGASPAASPDPDPAAEATRFASTAYPYTITLPAGWTVTSVSPEDTGDLFRGPDADARVGSPGPVPDQTAADRVAANREDVIGQGCSSDPAADASATLGGEAAIRWSFQCDAAQTFALNTIHDGVGYRLSVTVPAGSAADGPALLAELTMSFAFTAVPASPAGPLDLAAIDASLQGTWRTEWAPIDLWIASVVAAGLDPDALSGGTWTSDMRRATTRRSTLTFEGDQMTQYGAFDQGADVFGSQGTYTLVDPDTIDAIDPTGVFATSYDFTLRDGVLTIDVVSASDPLDLIPQTSIFETLPFTWVP